MSLYRLEWMGSGLVIELFLEVMLATRCADNQFALPSYTLGHRLIGGGIARVESQHDVRRRNWLKIYYAGHLKGEAGPPYTRTTLVLLPSQLAIDVNTRQTDLYVHHPVEIL